MIVLGRRQQNMASQSTLLVVPLYKTGYLPRNILRINMLAVMTELAEILALFGMYQKI